MRLNHRYKHLASLATCASLSLGGMLHAQGTNASIAGVVTDASGAAVASATVVVKNTGTAATRTITTDSAGRYEVTNLIPGAYEVSAEAPGFSKKLLTGITLQVGQQAGENIALAVGQNTDTVSVEATETLTQTESSENGTVIENKKVVELPLANRQFYALALLSPGVYAPAQTSTLGFRGGFSVAGASEETNLFTYNGIYNSSIGTQQPGYRPSVETIQEFKTLTGVYGPEYGKYSGAQIVVLEKQGSNALHGSAYWFVRNQATDAKPYFLPVGQKNPAVRQNTFGGTVGGPIFKDKTFFFGGFEGQNVSTQNTQQTTVPTPNMLAGLFPAPTTPAQSLTIPRLYNPYTGAELTVHSDGLYHLSDIASFSANAASAIAQAAQFAPYYPAPTIATAANVYPTNNYTFSAVQVESMKEFTVRIDHTLSVKDNLNASYQEFHDPTNEPNNTLCGAAVIPNGGCQFNQVVHLATFQESHIFTPNLLNTFSIGYNRFQMPRTPEDSFLPGTLPTLPGASLTVSAANRGLPNLAVSGYATLGGPTNIPQNQWLNQYNLVDAVSWNHGAHSFKFGIEGFLAITTELYIQTGRGAATFNSGTIAGNNATTTATGPVAGTTNCPLASSTTGKAILGSAALGTTTCYGTSGQSFADFFTGVPATTSRNPIAPNTHEGNYSFYGYASDNWKVAKNLTLNLGVRYEYNAPAYDSKNVISRFNPNGINGNGTKGIIEVGLNTALPASIAPLAAYFSPNTFKYLYNADMNNFAPRVGFAWQPFHNESTVVKGAYGIFYNGPIEFNQYISFSTQLPERAPQTFNAVQTTAGNVSIALDRPFNTTPGGPNRDPSVIDATPGTYTLYAAQNTQPTPYIHEWSLGVQQALTKSLVLEMVYLGTHGSHLANSRNINTSPLVAGQSKQIQANRAFPQWGSITYANDEDSSSFNSLQTKLQQTYKNGISYMVAYTYGKSIDQSGGTGSSSNSSGSFQDPTRPDRDRGLSDFNVKHRLVLSPVLELPFGRGKKYFSQGVTSAIFGGFQISGIFQFQTGRPFTVTDATSVSGTYAAADRPNLIGNPNGGPHTIQQWFNTSAFQIQGAGTYGTAGRNIVIGPQLTQLDATIAREFPIWERVKGQLRLETFNVLNHPNFYNPFGSSAQIGSSAFGTITQANNPRELQGAIRIKF